MNCIAAKIPACAWWIELHGEDQSRHMSETGPRPLQVKVIHFGGLHGLAFQIALQYHSMFLDRKPSQEICATRPVARTLFAAQAGFSFGLLGSV